MMLQALTSLLFPLRCVGCEAWLDDFQNKEICDACFLKLHFLKVPAFLPNLPKTYFKAAHSALAYEGLALKWVHQLKYHRQFHLVEPFAALLSESTIDWSPYDALVPVPLHWRRRIQRGFNLSHLLAESLAKRLQKPLWPCLKKTRVTRPQTGLKQEERLKNVKDVFVPARQRKNSLKEARLLLIDDVLTTGATVNECAKALIKAGAKKVDVLTLARPL